jgi:hypothetical protein
MANAPVQQSQPEDLNRGNLYLQNVNSETLSGDKTLSNDAAFAQVIDCDGSGRNLDLPSDETGLMYLIVNKSDNAKAITVRDDSDTTVVTVNQNDAALVYNTGSGYVSLLGNAATDQEV